jgi:hypothetical protein
MAEAGVRGRGLKRPNAITTGEKNTGDSSLYSDSCVGLSPGAPERIVKPPADRTQEGSIDVYPEQE